MNQPIAGPIRSWPAIVLFGLGAVFAAAAGCGEQDRPGEADPSERAVAPVPDSDWRQLEDAIVVRVDAEADDVRIAEAAERARTAAREARRRFDPPAPGAPDTWFACWAAATKAGGTEHVWMAIDVWNEHRLEGRLVSAPTRPLADGRARGDRVSIRANDLLDWVHRPLDGAEDGGFIAAALSASRGRAEHAKPAAPADDDS